MAIFGIASLVVDKSRLKFFLNSIGLKPLLILLYFLSFSFVIDITTGAIFNDILQTFTIRTISLFLISVIPAYYISFFYLKGDFDKLINMIFWAFLVQTLFFLLTYFDHSYKTMAYGLMGSSGSVNMSEMNFSLRGFGLSNEINFMTPFLMAIISLFYFKGIIFRVVIVSTQIINSNNVLVATILSLLFSRSNLIVKIILCIMGFVGFGYFAAEYLPRLVAEIDSGGVRTIGFLFENHFIFFNDGFLQHLLGSGVYVFGGLAERISDVGYVILYNYGGILMLLSFLVFILLICFRLGTSVSFKILWLITGLVLNFKGLAFGMNSYVFFSFLIIFNHQYKIGKYENLRR